MTVQTAGDGIHIIIGDIVPIQIIESKNLPEDENLFLRNLRSNLSGADIRKTLETYKERKPLNEKNVFLDRLIKANPNTFKEVQSMLSDEVISLFSDETIARIVKNAGKRGWLADRDSSLVAEKTKKIAEKMLVLGDSPEKVSEITELPIETVTSIEQQLKKIPVAH